MPGPPHRHARRARARDRRLGARTQRRRRPREMDVHDRAGSRQNGPRLPETNRHPRPTRLSVLTQVFAIVCLVGLLWVFFGYSMAFTNGGGLNPFVGGLSKAFLRGVAPESTAATFSNGVVIPEYVYICFQMTFAMITPALIVGAFAERMRFSALMLFIALWVTFVYFPIAHMVWYWAGPDAIADAARG